MVKDGWKFRARLLIQRFWQPTSACMTCMPGSLANLASLPHWKIALQTGLATGVLVLVLSYTPLSKAFRNRYGNAVAVGCLTALGDAYSHPGNYEAMPFLEAIITGCVSGVLALIAGFLLEDRARRLRAIWSRVSGRPA